MVVKKIKEKAGKFKREVKKALLTALIAAFGFLIALVWRDVLTELVNSAVSISPVQGQLISAIIVTLISVLGILLVTKLFSEKEEEKKK